VHVLTSPPPRFLLFIILFFPFLDSLLERLIAALQREREIAEGKRKRERERESERNVGKGERLKETYSSVRYLRVCVSVSCMFLCVLKIKAKEINKITTKEARS